jgi:hypothetical protein
LEAPLLVWTWVPGTEFREMIFRDTRNCMYGSVQEVRKDPALETYDVDG